MSLLASALEQTLIVFDMYEHAYDLDYGAAAAKYVDAFRQNVNWEEVNRRAEAAIEGDGRLNLKRVEEKLTAYHFWGAVSH
jgi:hypothetical protein